MSELLQNVIDEKSIQKLMPAAFKDQIADHLKKLPDPDRKMRFGYVASDESIQKYVDRMSEKDIIFASFCVNSNGFLKSGCEEILPIAFIVFA
mgnify:CR=1 FL=1